MLMDKNEKIIQDLIKQNEALKTQIKFYEGIINQTLKVESNFQIKTMCPQCQHHFEFIHKIQLDEFRKSTMELEVRLESEMIELSLNGMWNDPRIRVIVINWLQETIGNTSIEHRCPSCDYIEAYNYGIKDLLDIELWDKEFAEAMKNDVKEDEEND